MLSKMSNGKKRRLQPSLALQLNIRWLFKLLRVFVLVDLFVLALAFLAFLYVGELEAEKGYNLYRQSSDLNIPYIQVVKDQPEPNGFKLPTEINFIYDDTLPQVQRIIAGTQWTAHAWGADYIRNLKYCLYMHEEGQPLAIYYSNIQYVNIFLAFILALLTLQTLIWVVNIFSGIRSARRILKPITDMVQLASNFQTGDAQVMLSDMKILKDLAGTINQIDVEKLNIRIKIDENQKELRDLAQAINTMLNRIDEAYHTQARFVSDASHELKTPISVIQGYINLLDRWGKNDEKTMQEAIDAIKSETELMRDMINDLLFLARGDSNILEINRQELDIGILLEEIYRETVMIDGEHVFVLKPGGSMVIKADPALIKQAIRVLVDNAIQYTPAGQTITLSTAQQSHMVSISVQDNGLGIAAEDLPHIFDRFFRSDPSRTRKNGRSGLGLSIAKWIVDKHGGYFQVLSRLDIGTRITMCLPMK